MNPNKSKSLIENPFTIDDSVLLFLAQQIMIDSRSASLFSRITSAASTKKQKVANLIAEIVKSLNILFNSAKCFNLQRYFFFANDQARMTVNFT